MQAQPDPAIGAEVQDPHLAVTVGLVGARVVEGQGVVNRGTADGQRTGDRR